MRKKILLEKRFTLVLGLIISFFYGVSVSQAGEEHRHKKRQLSSHQHGISALKIAIEGRIVEMELESPADDIVGFEYSPKNDKQRAKIGRVLSLLREPKKMFLLPSNANCKIKDREADFEVEKEGNETHAAFHVTWKLNCSNPGQIRNLETNFFKLFPKAKKIEVQIVSGSGQKAIEWESNMKNISLRTSN